VIVPFAAPTRMSPAETEDVRRAVDRVLGSGTWILGEEVAAFEREFAAYLGTPAGTEVVGVGNGTDALAIAFSALGLTAGSAVLVAADEGGYAASAARQVGLGVRVMDLDAQTGAPSARTAAAATTSAVRAIVVTHLHGDAVPLSALDAWRRENGLLLVEDCAQAHGLRASGRHVGLTGDAATFSFYPTKNLGAAGDGGALVLAGPAAERARSLRQYGWVERYRVERAGGRNSRLDSLQAAVLRARLPHLESRNARRREIANRYRGLLPLHGDPSSTVAHHAVALLQDPVARDRLRAHLAARDVATAVHYPWLVTEMPGLDAEGGPCPVAAQRRDRQLSLPCFPELAEEEVEHVCAALGDWVATS
jgi:dTDP-4-amino-4,6-dideoxygalactose transaminase